MATLRDGLGGEELAESGLQAGATQISPYVTGSFNAAAGFVIPGSGVVDTIVAGSPNTGIGQVAVAGRQLQAGYAVVSSGTGGWITFPQAFGGPAEAIVVTSVDAAATNAFILPAVGNTGSVGAGSAWLRVSGAQAGSIYYTVVGP